MGQLDYGFVSKSSLREGIFHSYEAGIALVLLNGDHLYAIVDPMIHLIYYGLRTLMHRSYVCIINLLKVNVDGGSNS